MRRLFSTFAGGPPGVGLLLIRLLVGAAVAIHNCMILLSGPPLLPELLGYFSMALGVLVVAGLWTPVTGALIAGTALWATFGNAADLWYSLIVGVLGLALALLGPGAWSVDAYLFGWRRL